MDNETILKLLKANSKENFDAVINDDFLCSFVIEDNEAMQYFFSEFEKENNCQRSTCHANVRIYQYSKFKCCLGKIYISYDSDIEKYDMSICICDSNDSNKIVSMYNAVNCKFAAVKYSFVKFMSMLKHKPLAKVKEPFDSLGLSICTFKCHDKKEPNIEYGTDGLVYFEILDMKDYADGDLIPIKSEMRNVVVDYAFLSEENAYTIANKIDDALDALYSS